MLAPNLRFRQVNPGGYLELDSVQPYIDGTKAFLDGYHTHASITATAEQLGDHVLTTSRRRLDQNGDPLRDSTLRNRHRRPRQGHRD